MSDIDRAEESPIGFMLPDPEPDFADVILSLESQGKKLFILRKVEIQAPEWDE